MSKGPDETWADLVEDWQAKHDAVLRFGLYEKGWRKTELVPEYEALVAAKRSARSRMDGFKAEHLQGAAER
jgi:hypothetical protein